MKNFAPLLGLLAVCSALPASADALQPIVAMETSLGAIVIQLDAIHAPVTTANFLTYVKNGSYAGGQFYRTAQPIRIINPDKM